MLPGTARIINDIDSENKFKGRNGSTFMILLDVVNWEKDDRIGCDMTAPDLIIKSVYKVSIKHAVYNVQIMTNDPDYYIHNRFIEPGINYMNYRIINQNKNQL